MYRILPTEGDCQHYKRQNLTVYWVVRTVKQK